MPDFKHEYTDEVVCPWCGYEYSDSWEFGDDDDEMECVECDKGFSLTRRVEVSYSTQRNQCSEKCEYVLKNRHNENPYVYEGQSWTIYICTVCEYELVKVGELDSDGKAVLLPIDHKNIYIERKP